MDTSELKKLFEKLRSDKKAIFIISAGIIGMLLILLSDTGTSDKTASTETNANKSYISQQELAGEVEKLIESIDGAGRCKVMITYNSFDETVYAYDKDENISAQGETDYSGKYVIIDSGDKEDGLRLKTILPEIKGVAVVCQGGSNPVIKEQIVASLSALFDISSNKISVAVMAK
ncbi:MAG: hypothetical protein J6Q79_08570 [Clostridia bacterium]|nr:hypothetical protein [Clostridia bacterium]